MTVIRAALAGLLLAAVGVLAVPGTAHACSCVTADTEQFVEWADAVVWARVDVVDMPAMGNGDAHYLLTVEEVFQGSVTERVRVDSAASGAACGLEGIDADRRYVFFLEGGGSPYSAHLCGGTGFGVDRADLEAVGLTGGAPEAGGPTQLPLSAYSYAGMGLGALAALVGAGLVWRRSRSGAA
jgi:hypothetical protein